MAMLGAVGAALGRGAAQFVASSVHNHFHLRETSATRLTTGGADPLLPLLGERLDQATSVDLAIAFAMDSGVALLEPWFRELLARGGRLRMVVGDYLDTTDPTALARLLDLEGAEIFIFQTDGLSFHPKAWLFNNADAQGTAIVGSSNLSQSALTQGVEWNLHAEDAAVSVAGAFDELLQRPEVKPLTVEWIDAYAQRRRVRPLPEFSARIVAEEGPPPEPHSIQLEALAALELSRKNGHRAGLVVLATGLGKTWLAAFDTMRVNAHRILFVAHRDEILNQAMAAFRKVRPDAKLGRYTGAERETDADILFASIQTLGRVGHLRQFTPDHFDYVIVDEFHHAAARTYQNLIEHFSPRFLLGLTATPDRTDGADLLGLCGENLVYECDLFRGIDAERLSAFHYFGVPDDVDYAQIPWRSGQFDPSALDAALATEARAENALEQYRKRAKGPAIGFCCSMRHADYMANYFRAAGLRAVAVHSGQRSAPRASSLIALGRGEIDILFAVDMFNEGVDVPNIGTVLMLRPTESAIIWLQQLGRGLRRVEGKVLQVIDYIGNHRSFLTKVATLLQAGGGDRSISSKLDDLEAHAFQMPLGCEITYDLKVIDIIRSLLRPKEHAAELEAFYRDFRAKNRRRPSAVEVFRNSHDPRATGHGSWFDFVRDMGDPMPERPFATHGRLLKQVERQRGMPAAAMSALLEVLAGREPSEGAEDLALNDYMIQGTGGLRLVRPDTSGELAPLVRELIEWRLAETPIIRELAESATTFVGKPESLELWKRYFVPDIASFFGEVYQQNVWRTGIKTLPRKKIMILLANVATQDLNYQNELLGPSRLKWFSQNQTRQAGLHGRIISGQEGHEVHLFVRRGNIVNGRVNPFIYFGQPKFAGWTSDTPIEVLWDLPAPVPQEFWAELGVPVVG
jgi:superfamily II DNA or RNA helicase